MTFFAKTGAFAATSILAATAAFAAGDAGPTVGDDVIEAQRAALAASSEGKGFGPQAPRDLDSPSGENTNLFTPAQPYASMHLCNIHFHDAAEHKGGNFTTFVGNGDGAGSNTGFAYDGELTEAEMAAFDGQIGDGKYGGLFVGDTIEQHYVHTSAPITPGPTLGACLNPDVNINPSLRVETVVFVIVNDDSAGDMVELNKVEMVDGYWQAPNIPNDLGDRYIYTGSTTGPSYNEKASPIQVTWSVRPQVMKVSASSVAKWLEGNEFEETGSHGVRNLVQNPALLSQMQ